MAKRQFPVTTLFNANYQLAALFQDIKIFITLRFSPNLHILNRTIGTFTGSQHGALIIVIGAMHGNEPVGVHALKHLFEMFEKEKTHNSNFIFEGRLVGFIGNKEAFSRQKRFINVDLNRQLLPENIEALRRYPPQYKANFEDVELLELLQDIDYQILTYKPSRLIVLDIHSTSAEGGIFTIVGDAAPSLDLAMQLHTPVVRGMIGSVGGSTLHYFTEKNMHLPTIALAFEAGQHDEILSINRAFTWIMGVLQAIKAISPDDLSFTDNHILKNYSRDLPKIVELIYAHHIVPSDNFEMLPNFKNFQPIQKGDILARDRHGDIVSPHDCRILMPLYQPQGSDGFFLINDIK